VYGTGSENEVGLFLQPRTAQGKWQKIPLSRNL